MGRGDPTAEFFAALAARGYEPMLRNSRGSIRFDLTAGNTTERWLLRIERGELTVSRRHARAVCVVRTDKALFDGLVRGQVNALAAMLRGELRADGDRELLMRIQRLFPGPDDERKPS